MSNAESGGNWDDEDFESDAGEAWSSPRDNTHVGDETWDEVATQFAEEPRGDDDGVEVLQRLGLESQSCFGFN